MKRLKTDIKMIEHSAIAQDRYLNAIKSAKTEIMLILPTINTYYREKRIGILSLSKEAAQKKHVRVKILLPANDTTDKLIHSIDKQDVNDNFFIRNIQQISDSHGSTILVVDRKISIVFEIKDDSKHTFNEAIGSSTYSVNHSIVSTYIWVFDSLWMQSELYEQLRVYNKMQKEFINIAAHELRTPIQPILGLTEILRSGKLEYARYQEFLDIIFRNAKRLQRLTEGVLDVTRIEAGALQLRKEIFDIKEMISTIIAGYKNRITSIKLFSTEDTIFVEADDQMLSLVLDNILDNAIKFSSDNITIDIKRSKYNESVIVQVEDNGRGIDPEIFPRLFTKFTTKSFSGTGLGLFISKSIIEAHGGRMWAINNKDGKGATFSFSLPIADK
jgi:two-component system, OmpR family, sensor histidine kinase VicK